MKYIQIIIILLMCVSCTKNTGKADTSSAQKTPDKTEAHTSTEARDIFESDIFAHIPDSPLSITEECKITELSPVEISSLEIQDGMKSSLSGLYDSVILAESENFTLLYTVYNGTYKICHAAFYNQTPLDEKWSGYIGKSPYEPLVEFGTPAEIKDGSPNIMIYKKDLWLAGDGLTSTYITFFYENKKIHKVALWKQR